MGQRTFQWPENIDPALEKSLWGLGSQLPPGPESLRPGMRALYQVGIWKGIFRFPATHSSHVPKLESMPGIVIPKMSSLNAEPRSSPHLLTHLVNRIHQRPYCFKFPGSLEAQLGLGPYQSLATETPFGDLSPMPALYPESLMGTRTKQ